MSEMRVCRCCGDEIQGARCQRCGFVNPVILDSEGERDAVSRVEDYRERIISRIGEFAVYGYEYKWDDSSNQLKLQIKRAILLASEGRDCFTKEWWSEPLFGQGISDEIEEREIELSYKVDGAQKSIIAKIKPIANDNLLSIGLYIDEKFNLIIYLGSKQKHAQSEKYSLELK